MNCCAVPAPGVADVVATLLQAQLSEPFVEGLQQITHHAPGRPDGHLWHTLRRADGSWTGLGDVQSQIPMQGPVAAVAAANGASGEIQFMFTTASGALQRRILGPRYRPTRSKEPLARRQASLTRCLHSDCTLV
jgi:hypothetical protein